MARRKGSSGRGGRLYVPGVWSGVIRELREREAGSLARLLGDPRELLALDGSELSRLAEVARSDAERIFAQRFEEQAPVVVVKAVLRSPSLGVPKDELRGMLRDSLLKTVRVHPDDTIEPADSSPSHLGSVLSAS